MSHYASLSCFLPFFPSVRWTTILHIKRWGKLWKERRIYPKNKNDIHGYRRPFSNVPCPSRIKRSTSSWVWRRTAFLFEGLQSRLKTVIPHSSHVVGSSFSAYIWHIVHTPTYFRCESLWQCFFEKAKINRNETEIKAKQLYLNWKINNIFIIPTFLG